MGLLQEVRRFASTSEQRDALKNSELILHFIGGRGESSEFTGYFKDFNTELPAVLSFATKDDADTWLRKHPAPPHGATIQVGEELYTVAYSRELDHRRLLRVPSSAELALIDEEPADEAEPESRPAPLTQGTRFRFLDFFLWTAFHLHELEQHVSSPEQREAIKTAKIAFHFVMHNGEDHGFEEYRETLSPPNASRPVRVFATREEADAWLVKQPEPPDPTVIAIGNDRYSVGYDRLRSRRVLIHIPSEETYSGWKSA